MGDNMYAKVYGASTMGIDGYAVSVEVNISLGIPFFEIVGLPTASVREARERVRAAIVNSGYTFPLQRIIVNLAPADRKKEGCSLDLAIVIGILLASNQIRVEDVEHTVFAGELSLKGEINPIEGVLATALGVKADNFKHFYTSSLNLKGVNLSGLDDCKGFDSLKQCVQYLQTKKYQEPLIDYIEDDNNVNMHDLADVSGQFQAKRALEIAAAGGHNFMMTGPPGSGKTMLAQSMVSILPSLSKDEAVEVTKIYSVAGLLGRNKIMTQRPFRNPHHTVTTAGMIGGGSIPKPGEVTLSHNGVLFLDELPEFSRMVLEILRQPIEDRRVFLSRAHGTFEFPASFSLVVAMNPCPCGYFGDKEHACTCTESEIQRYQRKISGPLLDRIDLFVTVDRPKFKELRTKIKSESSAVVRERVLAARKIQEKRFALEQIKVNSQMSHKLVKKYCQLDEASEKLIEQVFHKYHLSARSYDRILKVSRTIADLNGKNNIEASDITEALFFRKQDSE